MTNLEEILKLPLDSQWKKFLETAEFPKWDILDFQESSVLELNQKYKEAEKAGYTLLGGPHWDKKVQTLRCYLVKLK
jgi:hypothetical protein